VANLSVKEMISAGVHFGHQSKYWNPKMRPFIFTTYKKLHIINLDKSIERFKTASAFIEKLARNNSKILFVGTKRAAREIIQRHATNVKMPYVNNSNKENNAFINNIKRNIIVMINASLASLNLISEVFFI